MGVPGLLVGLKSFAIKGTVRSYANQSLAVDLSGWLHKSVYSIADHFVEDDQMQKEQHQQSKHGSSSSSRSLNVSSSYIIQRCQELLRFAGVAKIYLVLDGRRCPMKSVTNDERERRRQENLKLARYHRDRGERDKAFERYKACIKVSSQMASAVARKVQHAFRNDPRVEIVQSPYEADAQLVQLVLDQKVQAVVTEDSDVLVYQAACHVHFPVIFKLDRNSGACDILSMEWLISPGTCSSAPWNHHHHRQPNDASETKMSVLDAVLKTLADREMRDPGLGARLFVQSCVLTGCDYSPNLLSGVGLVNAFKLVRNSVHRSNCDRFRHVLQQLPPKAKQSLGNKIEYEDLLAKSEAVFYHHMVYVSDGTTLAFLGDHPAIPNHGHKPVMDRFGGDWSFLGDVTCCDDGRVVAGPLRDAANNLDDVQRREASVSVAGYAVAAAMAATANVLISNPYQKSRKRQRQQPSNPSSPERKPLAAIDNTADRPANAGVSNSFSKFACKPDNLQKQQDPMFAKYRVFKGDPRFVKPTNFDDIQQSASRAFMRNISERASAWQRGSTASRSGSEENHSLQVEQDAHEASVAQSRSSSFHHNPQHAGATANAFPYDGASSRQSHASVNHESFEASAGRSQTDASHIASVHSSLNDGHRFHADFGDSGEPSVPGNFDATDHCLSVANASMDAMSNTLPAEEELPHVSLDSTEHLYNSACPNPMPPSPPKEAHPFEYYDHNFMCSPDPANYAVSNQELLADDIAEDSPSPPHQSQRAAMFGPPIGQAASLKSRFFDPRPPQSTIGPAKTIRPSLHQVVQQAQMGGLRRFQIQRPQQQQPPPRHPRACITQRHRPSSSSSSVRGGTKRARSSGTETKNRSILEFLPRR